MPPVRLPNPGQGHAGSSQNSEHGLIPSVEVKTARACVVRLLPARAEVTLREAQLHIAGWAPIPLEKLRLVYR